VESLHRTELAGVGLHGLKPGQWRDLIAQDFRFVAQALERETLGAPARAACRAYAYGKDQVQTACLLPCPPTATNRHLPLTHISSWPAALQRVVLFIFHPAA
jgi:hypothetical protein